MLKTLSPAKSPLQPLRVAIAPQLLSHHLWHLSWFCERFGVNYPGSTMETDFNVILIFVINCVILLQKMSQKPETIQRTHFAKTQEPENWIMNVTQRTKRWCDSSQLSFNFWQRHHLHHWNDFLKDQNCASNVKNKPAALAKRKCRSLVNQWDGLLQCHTQWTTVAFFDFVHCLVMAWWDKLGKHKLFVCVCSFVRNWWWAKICCIWMDAFTEEIFCCSTSIQN